MADPVGTVPQVELPRRRVGHLPVRIGFFGAMATVLLLAVLVGFSRTFYLRAVFDVPRVPSYVLVHGGILTAWFAGLLLQAVLVRTGRTGIHRQLGWWVAGIGLSVLAVTGPTILNLAVRQSVQNLAIDDRVVRIVWLDLAILVAFGVFLGTGILMRHRAAWHKRLMLLASISIITPAVGRMTEAEQQLHAVVRGYTVNGLKPLNEAMAKWLQTDTEFKLATSSRKSDVNVAKHLAELEPHLLMWLAKYAAWIPDSPAHALVYLADEENHGVPFPKGIERAIEESFGIETRAANIAAAAKLS